MPIVLTELFSLKKDIVENLFNNYIVILPLLALLSTLGLYFYFVLYHYKKKQWFHFWLTVVFFPYIWIYYIFFYEKGFNFANRIRKYIY
jgi:hypothetical protein